MVSPERIFHMMSAHVATQALRGGLELGLFTAIAEGNATIPALAARIGSSERGTRILADYLGVTGNTTLPRTPRLSLTPTLRPASASPTSSFT